VTMPEAGVWSNCEGWTRTVEARIRPLDGDQRLPAAFPSDGIPAHSGLNGSGWRREGSEPGHVVLRTFEQGNPTFAFARIGAVVISMVTAASSNPLR
jgi:hypothetical protein